MNQSKDIKYWESFFQSLQMTYYSLLAVPLFVFAIAFLRAENGNSKLIYLNAEQEMMIVSIIAISAVIVMLGVYFYARKKYKEASSEKDIFDKMNYYRKATLTKYITLCIAQILSVFAFLVTYHNGLMGVFTALLLFSSFFRPELTTARKSLKLSKEEFKQINYKNQVLL